MHLELGRLQYLLALPLSGKFVKRRTVSQCSFTHRMDRGYIELSGLVPPQDLLVVVRSVLGRKDNQRSRNLCTKLGLVFRCSNYGEVGRRQEFLLNFLRNDHIRSSLKDRGLIDC